MSNFFKKPNANNDISNEDKNISSQELKKQIDDFKNTPKQPGAFIEVDEIFTEQRVNDIEAGKSETPIDIDSPSDQNVYRHNKNGVVQMVIDDESTNFQNKVVIDDDSTN